MKRIPMTFAVPGLMLCCSYYDTDKGHSIRVNERAPSITGRVIPSPPSIAGMGRFSLIHEHRHADICGPVLKFLPGIMFPKITHMMEEEEGLDERSPSPQRPRASDDIWPPLKDYVPGITSAAHQALATLPSCWQCRGGSKRTVTIGDRKIPYKEKRCREVDASGLQCNAMIKFLLPCTGDEQYLIGQLLPPFAMWRCRWS